MESNKLEYKDIEISQLKPVDYNPRKIDKDAFEGLKKSIEKFGVVDPIIINKDYSIIGGHMRLEAAKALGYYTVPCVIVKFNDREAKELNVLLNSQSISGVWDDIKLSQILEELKMDDDYADLRLDELEPLNMQEPVVPETDEDLTDTSKLDTFMNGSIKQIVLYFDNEEYIDVMKRIDKIATDAGTEDNTATFMHILSFYEDNQGDEDN